MSPIPRDDEGRVGFVWASPIFLMCDLRRRAHPCKRAPISPKRLGLRMSRNSIPWRFGRGPAPTTPQQSGHHVPPSSAPFASAATARMPPTIPARGSHTSRGRSSTPYWRRELEKSNFNRADPADVLDRARVDRKFDVEHAKELTELQRGAEQLRAHAAPLRARLGVLRTDLEKAGHDLLFDRRPLASCASLLMSDARDLKLP
jgi:hypothetical protein